ncbi:MAG: phosphatidate cytidylyltransferase [Clostridiales bacterium]|jgi:phosphatidate cytidylyltransferase|nr:phosphatidate cytidylyltransferase [Clostridiales bacterium]
MLKQRAISAIVGIPLVLGITWIGGWLFFLMLAFVGHLALREFYRLAAVKDKAVQILAIAGHYFLMFTLWFWGAQSLSSAFILFFLLVNLYWVVTYPKDFRMLSAIMWGIMYVSLLLSFFLLIRIQPQGFTLVVAVFLAVWASDTGAYFIGTTFGRRRLAPSVSPKKSLEGALGGVVFSLLLFLLLAPQLNMPRDFAALFAIILSLAGQAGDLSESAFKRWSNTKDSGTFLPGHGGVLDRIDSLLFAAPTAFFLIHFFLR